MISTCCKGLPEGWLGMIELVCICLELKEGMENAWKAQADVILRATNGILHIGDTKTVENYKNSIFYE